MRGCLFIVLVGAVVLAVGAWLLAPTIAAAIVSGSLRASGFSADRQTLNVTADPPLRLLVGRADRLTLDAQGVTWHALTAARLGLELDDVDLLRRSAAAVHGRFDGVAVEDGAGGVASAAVATVTFDGAPSAATTTIELDRGSVQALVSAAAARSFSVDVTDVQLVSPDRLRLVAPGAAIEGSLRVTAPNQISLATRLGTVPLVAIDPSLPLRLRSVSVVGTNLQVLGVLDVAALLRGSEPG